MTRVGPEVPREWAEIFKGVRWGTLTDGLGWSYRFTSADARWAVPTISGESANLRDQEAVLWTMANRLYRARDEDELVGRGDYVFDYSFYGQLRIYCAPTNPYWLLHGAEEVRAGRARRHSAPPPDFPDETFDLVERFMTGGLVMQSRFEGLVHFAACDCTPGCGREGHGPETFKIDNCFWDSPSWPDGLVLRVKKAAGTKKRASSAVVPVALGVALGTAAVGIWRAS